MIINNVKLILEKEVVAGSLACENGVITAYADTPSQLPEAIDGEGGWLMPGMIELHTDNLDRFFAPRPKVDWPAHSAMSSHDALIIASGITTVLDAIGVGDVRDGGHRMDNLQKMIKAIRHSQKHGLNRAEHRLHLRCELPNDSTLPLFEQLMCIPELSLVSLMDHSPGQRQYVSLAAWRTYFGGKYQMSDAQLDAYQADQLRLAARWSAPNREAIAAWCRQYRIPLASHDDATHAHVQESQAIGSTIAEFPTTAEAARASRELGLQVLMGAPNIVRGGSHSGNVAAADLAAAGQLDILSSDYYPASLLDAAFRLAHDERNAFDLPAAIALVTRNPARAINLHDRGTIAEGLRADLVLVHEHQQQPYVRSVWAQGRMVF
ncbi:MULTISPECIES: alpha-D-ribose 1-methylphosphonate 5-triphosphate diphosphatase [unclassified Erwinia]|uniref:alpha-D-ribose 1-methylphosphonate 5-triphosphate diphosphatase n=1 Tax=unclassified Erwinia TaxID=2622719 RepID=UPI0006F7968A|nr:MULTISPECIES: alpha-D-ribose 1-methylphosphonate 5-triphosphate diphosphatase [unclassified Erwinia]KQN56606.1 phosphonate metabolism protein PhnM [Erwinia sp. Leaf53]PLV61363.1 phosphonate metabolism protein PhnM [Erwinia sp. B116]